MAKRLGKFPLIFLSLIFLSIISTFVFLFEKDIHIVFGASAPLGSSKMLPWDNSLNIEQSDNACGPYSTMAYAYSKAGLKLEPEKINREISGRFEDNSTYPWGVTEYLHKNKLETHIYFLGLLSKKQKLAWIKEKIESGSPVIVIVGNSEYSHYLTILGYKDDELYKYDSALSKDENGEELGNSTENYEGLLAMVESVRFEGFPINLAISN